MHGNLLLYIDVMRAIPRKILIKIEMCTCCSHSNFHFPSVDCLSIYFLMRSTRTVWLCNGLNKYPIHTHTHSPPDERHFVHAQCAHKIQLIYFACNLHCAFHSESTLWLMLWPTSSSSSDCREGFSLAHTRICVIIGRTAFCISHSIMS